MECDVYISYVPEDKEIARKIATELEWEGYKVWWQNQPVSGAESVANIRQLMQFDKVLIVIWSNDSVASGRVQAEARAASEFRRLIAVRTDRVIPPKETVAVAYSDLSNWTGGKQHGGFRKILNGIYELTGKGEHLEEIMPESASIGSSSNATAFMTDEEKDERAWKITKKHNTKLYYQHYLNHFPKGKYIREAADEIAKKKRTQRLIIFGVTVFVVLYYILIIALNLS